MFIEIMITIICGICFGIITGLIPGVHINLISVLILSYSGFLLGFFNPVSVGVFIISMAITHSFLDSIPSIYLGAPDAAMALNVLPGHRLLFRGEGHNAIIYTLIGSLSCLILAVLLVPVFIIAMRFLQPLISNYIGYGLIGIMIYMISREKKWYNAFLIFIFSGTLGLIVLNIPNMNQPLFPLLSGLFGVSLLLVSLLENSRIPKQKETKLKINRGVFVKTTFASTIVGFISAFLPGFGSSQAAIIAQQFVGEIGDEGFLALVGGINTAGMLISIVTAYTLSKARNGAILVVNKLVEIDLSVLLVFLSCCTVVGGIAFILLMFIQLM